MRKIIAGIGIFALLLSFTGPSLQYNAEDAYPHPTSYEEA